MFFFTFIFSILPLSCAQPQTRSSTPTPASTPTPTNSPHPTPLCPASVCTQYTFLPDLVNPQYWDVPSGQEYIWVNMWGSGGAVASNGGYGAFVSGALAVSSGEQLRVLVGSPVNIYEGLELGGCPSLSYGGGRSAIQRSNASGFFNDVVAAGGGGGDYAYCIGGDAGSGSTGYASSCRSPYVNVPGGESDSLGNCLVGVRNCGGNIGENGWGGGGWCGGSSDTSGSLSGGGGSSFSSPLQCTILADHVKGNFFETPFQAPGGAGQPGSSGAVIIAALPSGWQPCAAITSSPTPSATASSSSTPSPTPSSTPTISDSSSVTPTETVTPSETPSRTSTPSITSSESVTSSKTPSHTPTSSKIPSHTPTPSITSSFSSTPSITSSFSDTPSITSSFSATPSVTPSITSSGTPTPPPNSPPSSSSSSFSSILTSPTFSIAGWSIATMYMLSMAAWMIHHRWVASSATPPLASADTLEQFSADPLPQFSAPTEEYEALN